MTTLASPWDGAYRLPGPAPWDIGRPQPSFAALLDEGAVEAPVLDVGCGTGEHAILVASRGLDVMGVDVSEAAIERATSKARERGAAVEFVRHDALDLPALGRTFRTVIDSGVFHTFDPHDVPGYVASLRAVVEPGGFVHLLCFSERQPGAFGPRRVTERELRSSFVDGWTVESVEPATFVVNPPMGDAQAWLARIRRTG